jgi:hypothetical protein
MIKRCWLLLALASGANAQQSSPEMREILDRLIRLEAQNRELIDEVRSLREQLGGTGTVQSRGPTEEPQTADVVPLAAPLAERVEVTEQRVAELDQTRVASENKFPVTLTGMLLVNSYWNGPASVGAQYPVVVPPTGSTSGAGATFRQSVIGLKVDGPTILGGAKVTGAVYMDFYGGGTGLNQMMRLRVATLDMAWRKQTLGFAFDKPLIAPREPDSLAQVGVSPLTGSGNLWLWRPQVRVEQRHNWGDNAGVRAQFGVIQTSESGTGVSDEYSGTLAPARLGYEGRFELWTQARRGRYEIAPGFHASSSRVLGQSVESRIFSIDWLVKPVALLELTGAFFNGQNVGVIGGLRQGITVESVNSLPYAKPVHSTGGWAQLKIRATQRASFNLFGGQQDDRNSDLLEGGIAKNQSYGANFMYRLGPNFITSFEASQVRTTYLGSGTRINPHYDLAFAYLF